jgi:hypothetical protein
LKTACAARPMIFKANQATGTGAANCWHTPACET